MTYNHGSSVWLLLLLREVMLVLGLSFTPGSPCAALCLDASASNSASSTALLTSTTVSKRGTAEHTNTGPTALSTAAIAGIAVAIGAVLVGAALLFWLTWRRQRGTHHLEKRHHLNNYSSNPEVFLPAYDTRMSRPLRSYVGANDHHDEAPPYSTSGEYFNMIQQEMMQGRRVNYAFDPRSQGGGPGTALPTHAAYRHGSMSRQLAPLTARRVQPQHAHSRSDLSDSYALQIYLSSTEDATAAQIQPPPPTRGPSALNHRLSYTTLLPPPPPSRASRVPAISLPSVPKIRIAKTYDPPRVPSQGVTSEANNSGWIGTERRRVVHISGPVMGGCKERFQDRPLQGSQMYTHRRPESQLEIKRGFYEVPMRSGQSLLYGA